MQPWLGQAKTGAEHMLLVPVRTHRAWWCHTAKRARKIAWLAPVTFIGYDQAFPTPLCMMYFGLRFEAFDAAFSRLGVMGIFL